MKKNRTIKRLLAFLLCTAMMITYMPSSVYTFADETGGEAAVEQEAKAPAEPKASVAEQEKASEPESTLAAEETEPEPESAEETLAAEEAEPEPEPAEETAAVVIGEPADDAEPVDGQAMAPEVENPEAEKPAEADKPSDDAGLADEQTAEPEQDTESPEPEGSVESPEPEGTAEESDKEEAYPAHHFTGKADGVDVEVDAPEGSLPEGTTMKVNSVGLIQMAQVKSAVKEEMGKNTSVVKAVDITFYDAEGKEVQPKEDHPVSVSLTSGKFAELENPGVVHIDDKKNAEKLEDKAVDADGNEVAFEANQFSVYVVIETVTPRLTVKFVNGSTEIETMYIKKSDTAAEVEEIIFDPGAGTIPTGQVFKGWTIDENYTAGSTMMTIEQVRADAMRRAAALENGNPVEDGNVTYYAAVFKQFKVTYVDENEIVVGAEVAETPAREDQASYTVNMNYATDDTHNFEGWLVADGVSNIPEYPEGATPEGDQYYYVNGTTIEITGDVKFSVDAPSGYWLIFDENGKGATYNAPQFVKAGDTTQVPSLEMKRYGYSFEGWYTGPPSTPGGDPTGTEFTFGDALSETTTIYAKWKAKDTAKYSVIIWLENLAGDGYDFATAVSLSGTPGDTASGAVTVNGTAGTGASYVTVDGENYRGADNDAFKGFHYKEIKATNDDKVVPEGTTVVNVYYERTEYILKFYYARSRASGTQYVAVATTNRYGVPAWNSGYSYDESQTYYRSTNGQRAYYINGAFYQNQSGNQNQVVNRGTIYIQLSGQTYEVSMNYEGWNPTRWSGNVQNPVTASDKPGSAYGDEGSETRSGYTYYYRTLTAKYGTDIGAEWPEYNETDFETWHGLRAGSWAVMQNSQAYQTTGQGTIKGKITVMDEQILGDLTSENGNYVYANYDTARSQYDWVYHIYFENEAGGYYLYDDVYALSHDSGTNWQTQQHPPAYTGMTEVRRDRVGNNREINFYYKRDPKTITYMDGVYVTGDNNPVDGKAPVGELHQVTGIAYGADVRSYGEDGANYFVPTKDNVENESFDPSGFVFGGWYIDSECTHPYDFTTMPEGGITVYAKWVLTQYRVFLHPNAGKDPTLTWGSDSQKTSFRVSNGDKVSNVTGTRKGYEFYGWYKDEGLSKVFSINTVLNDSTVTTQYAKTEDTELDKWGYSEVEGNDDIDRFWITKKLDLYAKWGEVIVGADGIGVIYDDGDGTNAPTDTMLYKDNTTVCAGAASTPPTGQVFDHWVLQTWNGADYDDTETTVLPGDTFTILKSYAKITDNNGAVVSPEDVSEDGKYSYTVQLKAVYKNKGKETLTHIDWYSNYGSENEGKGALYKSDADIKFNKAVDIYSPAPTRAGYTFLGWTKTKGGTTADFLVYSSSGYTDSNGRVATQVAADEKNLNQGHDIFAAWKENEVTIKYAVASDSALFEGVSVAPESEKVKAATGTASGSTASCTTDAYAIDYWTLGDEADSEPVGDEAHFTPAKNDDGVYEEVTYYAHFKPNEVGYTIHHYLDGTTTKVAEDQTGTESIGETVTATAYATGADDLYDDYKAVESSRFYPKSGSIQISADSSANVINVYYKIPLTVASASKDWPYDSESHTYKVYTITYGNETITGTEGQTEFTLPTGDKLTVTPTDKGASGVKNVIDSGANKFTWVVENDESYNKGQDAYGTLTINPVDITISMADRTLTYNGETQYGWDRTDEGTETISGLVNNETVTITYTPSSGKLVGPYNNGEYDTTTLSIKDGETDVTKNYNLESATAGKLTIEKNTAELTVASASKDWDYDAAVHTYKVYTVTYGNESQTGTVGQTEFTLSTGDKVTVTPTEKGASGVKNVSEGGANSFTWSVENEGSYTKGRDTVGTLTINSVDITISMEDRTLPYNGQTQYGWNRTDADKETVNGLVNNETVTITYTPSSGKTVGPYTNGAYDTATLSIKDGETDVTENYNLTSATAGKLTIEKAEKKLKVASASKDWDYNASVHTYKVYTVTYGTEKIEGTVGQTEFTLSTGDKVTVTPTEKGANGVKNVSDSGANSFTWTVENEDDYTKDEDTVGTLTINPKDITISMEDRTLPYNGQTQYGWNRTDVGKETVSGLVNNETVTITYTPSSGKTVGPYNNGEYDTTTLSIKDGDTDVTENYNLTSATPGKLTINKNTAELKVASASKEWDYDAEVHTYKVYTVTYGTETITGTEGQTEFTLSTGDKVKVTPSGKGASGVKNVSDSGANSFTWTVENEESYTKGEDTVGMLTIEPKAVTVTAKSEAFTYDGKSHSNSGYDTVGLIGDDAIEAVITGSITFPSQSPVTNKVESYKFTEGSADNYSVQTVDGKLTMEKAEVAIAITAASQTWTYDGSAHENTAVTVTEGALLTGDTLVAEATGSAKNVADTAEGNNPVKTGYKIMHGAEDVTGNYTITAEAGTLTINPKAVTVTAQDKAFAYDGAAHTWPEYDVDGLTEEDEITAVVTGSITYPSQSPVTNKLESYKFTKGTAGNYTVTTADGTLTMTKASAEITITAASQAWTYDGKAHQNTIVTVTSGRLLLGDTLVAEATGSVTNAADTAAGNNPVKMGYKIMHGEKDVTDNYAITAVAGKLTIDPREVTLTSESDSKTYDGTALTKPGVKVSGDGFVEDEGAAYEVTGSQTLVGESKNTFTYTLNEGTLADNYKITKDEGTLKVTDGEGPGEPDVDDDLVVTKSEESKAPAGGYALGDTVTFTITATNIYEDERTITLEEIDGVTLAKSSFENVAGGKTVETTATYKITDADVVAGRFTNTVTAKVGNITKTADATVTTEEKNAHLTVSKTTTSRRPAEGYALGDKIAYRITVTNDGNVTISDITITDKLEGFSFDAGQKTSGITLAPGESASATGSYTVKEKDILAGEVVNEATASGKDPEGEDPEIEPGKKDDPIEKENPHLTVSKTTTSRTPANGYALGDEIGYEIRVTNDGNVTLTNIDITDTLVSFTEDSDKIESLAPGASAILKYQYTVTEADVAAGSVINSATASGTDPEDDPVDGEDDVTVPTDDSEDPDDDNPGGGGGTPAGGGGTPAGGGVPAINPGGGAIPADGTVVPDNPVPEVEPEVDIVDPETPLAEGTWALINLISAIVTALGAAVALFRKKEEEDEEEEGQDGAKKQKPEGEEEVDDNRGKKMLASKIAGAVAGVAAPITFLLTEDMNNPMALTDKWTILMLAMLAGQIVAAVLNKKASELDNEEEEAEAEAAN